MSSGARKDLRAMRQEKRRDTGIYPSQSFVKVRTAGAQVIDSGNGNGALFGLNQLMSVVQERDPGVPKNRPEFAQLSVPVFMVSQRGESAVTRLHPCHLLQTARKKGNRVRNEVAGE